ncbi:hypothetical protein RDABS01_039857, partial [Bienertia sinuspersici]
MGVNGVERRKRRKIFRFEEMWNRDRSVRKSLLLHGRRVVTLMQGFGLQRACGNLSQHEGGPTMVHELIQNERWNDQLLHSLFTEAEVKAILEIPVPYQPDKDVWAWHHSRDGMSTPMQKWVMEWSAWGGVVRDYAGDVVLATCWQMVGNFDVVVAEAVALRHGLRVSMEAGYRDVVLETDSMQLYWALTKGYNVASSI